MKIGKKLFVSSVILAGCFGLSGCLNGIKATDYRRFEVGELTRAESGTLISQQSVVLSSWWPFGLGPSGTKKARGEKVTRQRRGISYYVKLDRTGETLSITQADDVYIANGASVWVQFGERTRVFPK